MSQSAHLSWNVEKTHFCDTLFDHQIDLENFCRVDRTNGQLGCWIPQDRWKFNWPFLANPAPMLIGNTMLQRNAIYWSTKRYIYTSKRVPEAQSRELMKRRKRKFGGQSLTTGWSWHQSFTASQCQLFQCVELHNSSPLTCSLLELSPFKYWLPAIIGKFVEIF